MDAETTKRLEEILKQVKSDSGANGYLDSHKDDRYSSFSDYMNAYIGEKDIRIPTLCERSGISQDYIYGILNGKKNPSRDKVLALCIGSGMTYDETNRALEIAKLGIIYPKDERDVRIAIAINQGICDVTRVNEILDSYSLKIL